MAPLKVLSHLFPREGVQLGRLVTNMKAPQSDYYPTGKIRYLKDDIYSIKGKDFLDMHGKSTDLKLEAVLTSVLSAVFKRSGNVDTSIADTVCITYFLDNTDHKFEKMCREKMTREWFEKAYKKRKHVFLVTAIQTITEASLQLTEDQTSGAKIEGTVPVSNMAGNPVPVPALDPKLVLERLTTRHRETGFVAEGEQIYAIQYRKVRFELLSSRDMDHAYLEEGNRWKVMWKTMGAQKDQKDVLEVTLGGEEDLDDGIALSEDLVKDGIESCDVEGTTVLFVPE